MAYFKPQNAFEAISAMACTGMTRRDVVEWSWCRCAGEISFCRNRRQSLGSWHRSHTHKI